VGIDYVIVNGAGRRPTFRVPGYPVTPFLFVAAAGAVVLTTIVSKPEEIALGAGILVLGALAYLMWRSRASQTARE
jgi:APA family basic amino acid/polyamine antiporter